MISETQKKKEKQIVYIAIVSVLLIVLFMAGMKSGNSKLNSLLDLGQKYLNDMKYEEAIAAFDQAIAIEPKCEQAYLGKAKAQYALGQNDQAVETLMLGMEQVEDDSQLSALYLEILYSDLNKDENDGLKEEAEEVKLEEQKNAPFLLNYSEIVRYTNTENPTIQLEIIGQENKEINLTWTSSDENCATVSGDGLVTCKEEQGYAYITVTDGKKYAGCAVRIIDSATSQTPESEKVCVWVGEEGEEQYVAVVVEDTDEEEEGGTIDLPGGYAGYVYYSGDVEIPEHLTYEDKEIKIKEIGGHAFYACDELNSVTIPASIEMIQGYYNSERNPFVDCINLKDIKVDENNEFYKSEDGVLYSKDGKILLAYPADKEEKSYVIPKEVELIYEGAFVGCRNLDEICVEEGNARYVSLNGVLIDGKEYSLMAYPGGNKNSIYQIPQGVETVGYKAFYGSELKVIECSPEVTNVEGAAFSSCSNLEKVLGMKNVPTITHNLFSDCPNLKTIEGGAGTKWISIGLDNIWFEPNKIAISGLENMANLEHLSVTTSAILDITTISTLTNLKSLEIYEDTQKIDFDAIGKLGNLEQLYVVKVNELSDLSWVAHMNKLERVEINVDKFTITDLSPLLGTSNLNYIDIGRVVRDGSEIVLDENIAKQIDELKAAKPDVSISIMED